MRACAKRLGLLAKPTLWSRSIGRGFSSSMKESMDKLRMPYHPDLILDFSKIVSIVKQKQAAFEQAPYSITAFNNYVSVTTC